MALLQDSGPVTKVRGALLAAAAAGLLLGTAATAQAAPHEAPSDNWLYVSVTQGDTAPGHTVGTVLRCPSASFGTGHPHAAEACRELTAADGEIKKLPVRDTLCSMIYRPVTAHSHGMWNGRHVAYTHTFANACVLHASTGSVFEIDGSAPVG